MNQFGQRNNGFFGNSTNTGGTVTSVGLSMPSPESPAYSVSNSPITNNGTLVVTANGSASQYVRGDGSLAAFPSLSAFVPYTGATADVDLGSFGLNAKYLKVKGTGGNGYIGLIRQSVNATASINESSLFANNNGDISWQNYNLYLSVWATSANTANRTYTFPDRNVTIDNITTSTTSNGTGFIKSNGTNITFDNSTYLTTSTAASTYFPLAGGDLTGVGGLGYVGLIAQSSNPSTPATGVRIFANSSNAFGWINSLGFTRSFSNPSAASNLAFTLPNANTTLAGLAITQTFSAVNTFSSGIISPTITGGTLTSSTLTFQTTTGNATTSSDFIWLNGNNGAIEQMRLMYSGGGANAGVLKIAQVSGYASLTLASASGNQIIFNPSGAYAGGFVGNVFIVSNAGSTAGAIVIGKNGGNVASACLEIQSTTQGVLFPRMTTTQKNAVSSPLAGLVVYDSTLNKLCVYTGSAWETITSV